MVARRLRGPRPGHTWLVVLLATAVAVTLGGATSSLLVGAGEPVAPLAGPAPPTGIGPTTSSGEEVVVVLAAGDIARCSADADELVADLLDELDGTVVTLGDNAYPSGTLEDFQECYGPSWGRHLERTRPAAGNHEYKTPGAAGHFAYFGQRAGDPDKGYYSYPLGSSWHAIVLNSNCDHVNGGCGDDSPQVEWLRAELAAHADHNILAYWHHPVFSSGFHGPTRRTETFWRVLHDAGADVVLVAHDHHYERFAPLDADGRPDPERGTRQFVVGTGGGKLRPFPGPPMPATEVRDADTHGVLRLELHPASYRWEFLPVEGLTFTDSGTAAVNPGPGR